mmetsp:Transcript_10476/g.15971  ORF Transcript_10476/g.15971 Transcript_10476/m.15971 type:complete len:330 (-) Transcript_10476:116-1105(-)|eukprot:CAMPEP_0185025316 /NCGR_PEP_ID=MMETSP1103-20130426/8326_1 /TAXON_ID=36769 /ORGANISM="Paraphysomonas bandaiensis, Strain Caron Lab Isolate" /LENGTH=329 /DNA_ID=CAMNT_0027558495 /DNA_START=125 /DNA_END=1114 /DNA_ORIENTATION=+
MKVYSILTTVVALLASVHTAQGNDVPANPYRIITLSRTGDGKSSLCNLIISILGDMMGFNFFGESSGASSHTIDPTSFQVKTQSGVLFDIIDTPGLMESKGSSADEANIKRIVDYTKEKKYINGFLIVLNEQAPRFDRGMQDALKVFVDSYGLSFLDNVGIVFTRSLTKSPEESEKYVSEEFIPLLSTALGVPIKHLPHWQVDCHPDELRKLSVPEEIITNSNMRNAKTVHAIKQWAMGKTPFDVTQAHYGEFEAQAKLRMAAEEAKKKDDENKAALEAERAKRQKAEAEAAAAREAIQGGDPSLGDKILGKDGNRVFKKAKKILRKIF